MVLQLSNGGKKKCLNLFDFCVNLPGKILSIGDSPNGLDLLLFTVFMRQNIPLDLFRYLSFDTQLKIF